MSELITSSVKDHALIAKRRKQIVKAAIQLFKQKGFEKTTTREIAKQSGFSIGTLYEYVRTKEDVLILVFEDINNNMFKHLQQIIESQKPSVQSLIKVVDAFYRLTDEFQEEILILYQELKSLPQEVRETILQKEVEMVNMVQNAILQFAPISLSKEEAELAANNIFVQGHMWSFRRWALQKKYSLDEYIRMQLVFIFRMLDLEEIEVKLERS